MHNARMPLDANRLALWAKYCTNAPAPSPVTISPKMVSAVFTLPPMAPTLETAVQRRLRAPPWNSQAAWLPPGMHFICTVAGTNSPLNDLPWWVQVCPHCYHGIGTDDVRFEASTRIDNKGANVSLWDSGTAIECSNCHHVIFKKLRLDGRADSLFFEDAIKNHYWSDKRIEFVGYSGIQIIAGTYVEISEMVIHDMLCTGVYLKGTRYVTVKNNILYRIGHHCMVGGGGLMYGGIGQVPGDYGDSDPDDPDAWRMDYYGNLVFDVEQRLYSWVKKDNTLTMHLDEERHWIPRGLQLTITPSSGSLKTSCCSRVS